MPRLKELAEKCPTSPPNEGFPVDKSSSSLNYPIILLRVYASAFLLTACAPEATPAARPEGPSPQPSPSPKPIETVKPSPSPKPIETVKPSPSPKPIETVKPETAQTTATPSLEKGTVSPQLEMGQVLSVGGVDLKLRTPTAEELAKRIGEVGKGWMIFTVVNSSGQEVVPFFMGVGGPHNTQEVVLPVAPKGFIWDENTQTWQKLTPEGKVQVFIPDVLLPGGWIPGENEDESFAGPSHLADQAILLTDGEGNLRVGIIYSPETVAEIPDKNNLLILPDGSGLFIGDPKTFNLEPGQKLERLKSGELRLVNPDGTYSVRKTSWGQVKSKSELHQAGQFAGPYAENPVIPYPPEQFVAEIIKILPLPEDAVLEYSLIGKNGENPVLVVSYPNKDTGQQEKLVVAYADQKPGQQPSWHSTALPLDPEFVNQYGVVPQIPESLLNIKSPNAPIPQFTNAMKQAGIDLKQKTKDVDGNEIIIPAEEVVKNNLEFQIITGTDGKPYVVAYYNLDPNPKKKGETLEGPVPLLIAKQDEKGKWGWKRIYWSDISPIPISAFFNRAEDVESLKYDPDVYLNYTYATIPFLWGYDYEVNNLRDLNYRLEGVRQRGYEIMTGGLDCEYILKRANSKKEALDLVRKQLEFIKDKINPKVIMPLGEIHNGTPTYTFVNNFGGNQFIIDIYKLAREIFGDRVILVYNETYNYDKRTPFLPLTRGIVDLLNKENLNVYAGMQMHINQYPHHKEVVPNAQRIKEAMESINAPVLITEFDVNKDTITPYEQAKRAYEVVSGCLSAKNCIMIGFWATLDPGHDYFYPAVNSAPFTSKGEPNLMYYAIMKAFWDHH